MHRAREATAVGKPFPDFSGTTLNGRQIDEAYSVSCHLGERVAHRLAFRMLISEQYNVLSIPSRPPFPRDLIRTTDPGELEEFSIDTSKASAAARYQMGLPVPKYDVLPMRAKKREKTRTY